MGARALRAVGGRGVRWVAVAVPVVVMVALLPPAAGTASSAGDGRLPVILQARSGAIVAAARQVEQVGGQAGRPLQVINGFTALVPAGQVDRLQRSPAVADSYAGDTTNFLGMAPDARIVSVKVADGHGRGRRQPDHRRHRLGGPEQDHQRAQHPGAEPVVRHQHHPSLHHRPAVPRRGGGLAQGDHRGRGHRQRRLLHDPERCRADQPGLRPLRHRRRGHRHQQDPVDD